MNAILHSGSFQKLALLLGMGAGSVVTLSETPTWLALTGSAFFMIGIAATSVCAVFDAWKRWHDLREELRAEIQHIAVVEKERKDELDKLQSERICQERRVRGACPLSDLPPEVIEVMKKATQQIFLTKP